MEKTNFYNLMEPTSAPSRSLATPSGWYVIAMANQLQTSQLITKRIFGREMVLYRTAKGVACLSDAYCPHMGGHFGHGGCVEGEMLVCPFHKFAFDTKGSCTQTGYGTPPPPRAVLKTYLIQEKNGLILFWYHPNDQAPNWEIPEADHTDWMELKTTTFSIRSHPQEISENSVDLGHFAAVHRYRNVKVIRDAYAEGPFLFGAYGFERDPEGFFGAASKGITAEFSFSMFGLGYAFVEVNLPQMQLKTRQYVFPLPTEDNRIELRIAMSIHKQYKQGKIHPALSVVPKKMMDRFLMNKAFAGYAHDVSQDFKIWENKIYLDHPALAKGDGPIGKYRLWAKQFYS